MKQRVAARIGWTIAASLGVAACASALCVSPGCVTPKTAVRDSPITTSGPAGPLSESPVQSPVQQGGFNLSWQQVKYGGSGGLLLLAGFMYWRNTLAMKTITLAVLSRLRHPRAPKRSTFAENRDKRRSNR